MISGINPRRQSLLTRPSERALGNSQLKAMAAAAEQAIGAAVTGQRELWETAEPGGTDTQLSLPARCLRSGKLSHVCPRCPPASTAACAGPSPQICPRRLNTRGSCRQQDGNTRFQEPFDSLSLSRAPKSGLSPSVSPPTSEIPVCLTPLLLKHKHILLEPADDAAALLTATSGSTKQMYHEN